MKHVIPPREASGRFTGRGAIKSQAPAPVTLYTPVGDAEDRLRDAMGGAIEQLVGMEDPEGDAPVPVAVAAASPGAGKSRIARELLARCMNGETVAYHAPTLALAEEAAAHAEELCSPVELVRGRSAPDPACAEEKMCRKADLVERGVRLGLRIQESFCQSRTDPTRRCEFFATCAYRRQFSGPDEPRHRYLATRYLAFPDPTGTAPTLRVVDETFWMQHLDIVSISAGSFTSPRTFLRQRDRTGRKRDALVSRHADLLAAARAVVDIMNEGRSPLELDYDADQFQEFARLEHLSHAPDPGLEPDQPAHCQHELLAEAERNARHASWFAAIWTCLADAKRKGRQYTERLLLAHGHDGQRLRLCRRHDLQHRQPTLLLDADADAEILSALGCDVRQVSHMVLRPVAEVIQIHDRRMTHGSLLEGTELRKDWRSVIAREVLLDQEREGGGVLVGASRKVVQAFFRDAGYCFEDMTDAEMSNFMLDTKLLGANWLWFGGRALGSNRYRNCSTVVVIGREELPATALEEYGRALWGDRPGADLAFLKPDADGFICMPEVEVPYEMTDGSAWSALVACHPDPLIRRVQYQTRELATRQLVERLRLARSDARKRVVLGCNIPIPGLPVDELITWEQFLPKRHQAALFEALLAQGGLRLSISGCVKDAPASFPTDDAAKGYFKRNKVAPANLMAGLPPEITRRLHVVTLRQDRPYARDVTVIVRADSVSDALRRAGTIWGPLKHCDLVKPRQRRCA